MTEYTIRDSLPLLLRLWRNKWIILFITIAGLFAGMAYIAGVETKVSYRASASVCVTYVSYQEQMQGNSVITSYSDLVGSSLVCQRAAELLEGTGLSATDIQGMVENQMAGNSYVMYINATAEEPRLAIQVANAVAQAFTEKVSMVSGNSAIQVLDIAYQAEGHADSPYTILLIAAAIPFVLACGWVVLKEIISGKVRFLSQCVEDPEELLGILPDTKQRWA